jgi:hypothetical protein
MPSEFLLSEAARSQSTSMLVLLDHSAPAPLSACLTGHTVVEAKDRGWDRLSNGDLLEQAERAGFDVLITADKNMRYQQNLSRRRIALLILSTPRWPVIQLHIEKIAAALNSATPSTYTEVELPAR